MTPDRPICPKCNSPDHVRMVKNARNLLFALHNSWFLRVRGAFEAAELPVRYTCRDCGYSFTQFSAARESLRCPKCSYDLRGSVSGKCPECGTAVPSRILDRIAVKPGE